MAFPGEPLAVAPAPVAQPTVFRFTATGERFRRADPRRTGVSVKRRHPKLAFKAAGPTVPTGHTWLHPFRDAVVISLAPEPPDGYVPGWGSAGLGSLLFVDEDQHVNRILLELPAARMAFVDSGQLGALRAWLSTPPPLQRVRPKKTGIEPLTAYPAWVDAHLSMVAASFREEELTLARSTQSSIALFG